MSAPFVDVAEEGREAAVRRFDHTRLAAQIAPLYRSLATRAL